MTGDTSLTAPSQENPYTCGLQGRGTNAEYFRFTGTGSCFSAELQSTEYQPKLAVLTGPCSELQCYHQSLTELLYGDEQGASEVFEKAKSTIFPTEAGVEYTVAVMNAQYEGTGTGSYTLAMVCL